jgi:hypothetical protein
MDPEFFEAFKVKDGLGCSPSVDKSGVGCKMLVFNNAPIPMTVDGFDRKNIAVVFTVLNTLQEGFSKVPYENVNGKTKVGLDSLPRVSSSSTLTRLLQVNSNAKPLNLKSKMSDDSELCKMKCWPFGIVEGCPKDKDERVDDWSWEIVPGMALR